MNTAEIIIDIIEENSDIKKKYKILDEKCAEIITKIRNRKITNGRKKKQG